MKKPNIKISPQNKMSKEQMKRFSPLMEKKQKTDKGDSMISIQEGKYSMLFIYGVPLQFQGTSNVHFMASIQHRIKENKIRLMGRMRFEDTQRKTTFRGKTLDCTKENIEKLKEEIRKMATIMEIELPYKAAKPHFELEFKVGESIESIMQKMNDSNEFNIGQVPIKKNKPTKK